MFGGNAIAYCVEKMFCNVGPYPGKKMSEQSNIDFHFPDLNLSNEWTMVMTSKYRKTFSFYRLRTSKLECFVPGEPLKPSLMVVGKAKGVDYST